MIHYFLLNIRKCVFDSAVTRRGAVDKGFAVRLGCVFTQTPPTLAKACCLIATPSLAQSIWKAIIFWCGLLLRIWNADVQNEGFCLWCNSSDLFRGEWTENVSSLKPIASNQWEQCIKSAEEHMRPAVWRGGKMEKELARLSIWDQDIN